MPPSSSLQKSIPLNPVPNVQNFRGQKSGLDIWRLLHGGAKICTFVCHHEKITFHSGASASGQPHTSKKMGTHRCQKIWLQSLRTDAEGGRREEGVSPSGGELCYSGSTQAFRPGRITFIRPGFGSKSHSHPDI